jgi:uncharacterized damage-inducible protein DinB/ribosomal protein S18 acetylase RimI-like enzyme
MSGGLYWDGQPYQATWSKETIASMDLLDRLLGHDAWTTRQFLDICRRLDDAQLDREFDCGHRTVRATLLHLIRNMEVWCDLMAGGPIRTDEGKTPVGRSITGLTARLDVVAADLARIARDVASRSAWDDRWTDFLDNPPREKTYGAAVGHIITHSMHHRAQLLYLLRLTGVSDLPEGDVFSWENQSHGAAKQSVLSGPSGIAMSHPVSQFSFREIGVDELDEIRPQWEKLNAHHAAMTQHFGGAIRQRTFAARKAELIAKAGKLRVEIAYSRPLSESVAYCISTVSADGIGEIDSLFVEEHLRGKGIGSSLMRRALAWLDSMKAATKVVSVLAENEEALAFYERLGFYPRTLVLQSIHESTGPENV